MSSRATSEGDPDVPNIEDMKFEMDELICPSIVVVPVILLVAPSALALRVPVIVVWPAMLAVSFCAVAVMTPDVDPASP